MKRIALHPLRLWRRYANLPCLAAAFFLGLPTVCLISAALWLILTTWHTPSVQTRIRVEADLSTCTLEEADLPNGWHIRSVESYDLYERVLPGRALGGIKVAFFSSGSRNYADGFHSILLYRTARGAESQFERHKFSYSSRFYKSWVEMDLKEASLSADESQVICADFVSEGGPGIPSTLCLAKVRYDRFLSLLHARVSAAKMSTEEVVQTLQTTDRKMLQCVDSFADKEWE